MTAHTVRLPTLARTLYSLYGLRHKALYSVLVGAWYLIQLTAMQLQNSFDSKGCLMHHMIGSQTHVCLV